MAIITNPVTEVVIIVELPTEGISGLVFFIIFGVGRINIGAGVAIPLIAIIDDVGEIDEFGIDADIVAVTVGNGAIVEIGTIFILGITTIFIVGVGFFVILIIGVADGVAV